MRALVQSGISAAAIAERLNRSKAAVHKRARGLGLTLKLVVVRTRLPGDCFLICQFDNSPLWGNVLACAPFGSLVEPGLRRSQNPNLSI
jgi:hypothetical protein